MQNEQGDPLRRVQEDLAAMKAALGDGLPHDRSHAALYFAGAGFGAVLAALALLGLEAYVRPVMGAGAALMLAAWAFQVRRLRARQGEAPALWRWGKRETKASLVAIVLVVGYVVWASELARREGHWGLREALWVASPLLFCLGAAGCAWVAADRRRWPNLGAAVALLAGGFLLPLCGDRAQLHLLLGAVILAGGVCSGLLVLLQLRGLAHAD